MKKLIILPLCLFLFANCSSRKKQTENKVHYFEQKIHRSEILPEQDIRCNERSCPEAVGRVLFYDTQGYAEGTCSGFLIRKNIFVTNGHCLPKHLKSAGASCYQAMDFIFPGLFRKAINDYIPQAHANCGQILYYSESAYEDQDVAVIKLRNPVDRTPFEVDVNGIADREIVNIWSVMQISPQRADIQRTRCQTVMNNLVYTPYTNSKSRSVVTSGCNTVAGNSGSGVIKEGNGKVAAVHSSVPTDELLNEIQSRERISININQLRFSSNLACVANKYVNNNKLPDSCKEIDHINNYDQLRNKIVHDQIEAGKRIAADSIVQWDARDSDQYFKFEVAQKEKNAVIITMPVPSCFKMKEMKKRAGLNNIRHTVEDAFVLKTQILVNNNLQVIHDTEEIDSEMTIGLNPQDFLARNQALVDFILEIRELSFDYSQRLPVNSPCNP